MVPDYYSLCLIFISFLLVKPPLNSPQSLMLEHNNIPTVTFNGTKEWGVEICALWLVATVAARLSLANFSLWPVQMSSGAEWDCAHRLCANGPPGVFFVFTKTVSTDSAEERMNQLACELVLHSPTHFLNPVSIKTLTAHFSSWGAWDEVNNPWTQIKWEMFLCRGRWENVFKCLELV